MSVCASGVSLEPPNRSRCDLEGSEGIIENHYTLASLKRDETVTEQEQGCGGGRFVAGAVAGRQPRRCSHYY
ncbi:hypothetical protein EVAR_97466_1 [Eumeta japonica]|uniref:Uncharacterized protein n=1 Tax=Eumeta variegata TaxID=151549 RepID=A0A4C1X111_EUMVA|nr:hypothetical protein EVAR_97466_1 [Eumeta japonica]